MFQSTGVDSLVLSRFRFAAPKLAVLDMEMSEKRLPVDLARLYVDAEGDSPGGWKTPAFKTEPVRVLESNRYAPGTWNSAVNAMAGEWASCGRSKRASKWYPPLGVSRRLVVLSVWLPGTRRAKGWTGQLGEDVVRLAADEL